MRTARSILVAGALTLSTLGGTASAASPAAPADERTAPINDQISGAVVGEVSIDSSRECFFVYQKYEITYVAEQGTGRTGSLRIEGCVAGDSARSAPNGASLLDRFTAAPSRSSTRPHVASRERHAELPPNDGPDRLTSVDFLLGAGWSFTGTLDARLVRH
jgi:hypothetical protein